jgi:hypothetical protein
VGGRSSPASDTHSADAPREPQRDSFDIPGPMLVLRQGQRVAVTEPAQVTLAPGEIVDVAVGLTAAGSLQRLTRSER